MAKYRILKRTTVTNQLHYNISYIIQKRILFWYYNIDMYNTDVIDKIRCKVYITPAIFADKDNALKYLDKLRHFSKIKYRGCTIIKDNDLFVNIEFKVDEYKDYYLWSFKLSTLKEMIDTILGKTKDTYIY